jgi:N-acetylglucosaminyldiphosphoundecaprenol N-acetyl-beta-D-mannosaminyltransferase
MATAPPVPPVLVDGIPFDPITFDHAVDLIARWAIEGSGGYVVTPNVDYVVKARRNPAFREALLGARLRVPDGMGIVYGSRVAGRPLPGTVTGRLLPEAVGRRLAANGRSIAVFGGPPGVAEAAAAELTRRGARVAFAGSPPLGLRPGSAEDLAAVREIAASGASVVFVGLGAPKQELWLEAHQRELGTSVLVGVGAALDLLAGRFRIAPPWMTRLGLEWAFRLAQEPRRLARRYLWDDPRFFGWMLASRVRGRRSQA